MSGQHAGTVMQCVGCQSYLKVREGCYFDHDDPCPICGNQGTARVLYSSSYSITEVGSLLPEPPS